ncbi:PREDICTED: UPF0668 protein C10orf76 homolog [Buceros rhinoceros silvestris]|uniref:UPF0668 protein C10orf76 homolog n=1 Tax=Buceros rhinoceros silvestris TaxID=175836 RepID=UPI00052852FF|nr:PREDICTED: UPF0668 protein C10orf76 homolog [Buceros rhinoceros silvestris]
MREEELYHVQSLPLIVYAGQECAFGRASNTVRAIINHFNPKIESYAAVNHISQLSEDQVLEVVRSNYDTLTLKLQDGLDQYERYSEQHKEAAFFKELVRSISINVRKNLAFNTLSQELLLKEFSTIS